MQLSISKQPIMSSSCFVSGNWNSNDEEVDQTQVSTLAAQFLNSGYDKVKLQLKSNNHYLAPKLNGFPNYTDLMIQVLRNHHLSFALHATVPIPETYATQFLMSSYVCNHEEYGLCIVGYVLHPETKAYATLHLNVELLRSSLHLPDLEDLALDEFDTVPSEEEVVGFLPFLNYREDPKNPLNKRGDFGRIGLPPLWNTLFSILNFYLTGKVGGYDQSSKSLLAIMYGMYFDLNLYFEDMVNLIRKKHVTQSSTSDKRKEPTNLILQRFFRLCFGAQLESKLGPTSAKPAKFYPLEKFNPTIHGLGYENPRPMSKAMLNHLESSSRKAYKRAYRRPEPVPATPARIGYPLGQSDSRIEGEQEEPEVAGERVLEGEENIPMRVDRSEDPPVKKPKKKKSKRKAAEVIGLEEATTEAPTPEEQPPKKKHKKSQTKHSETIPEQSPKKRNSKRSKRTKDTSPDVKTSDAMTTEPSSSPIRRVEQSSGAFSPIQEHAPLSSPEQKLRRICKALALGSKDLFHFQPPQSTAALTHDQTPESLFEIVITNVLDVPQISYPEWLIPHWLSSKLQPQSSSLSAFATAESHSWAMAGRETDLQDDLLSKEVVIVEEDDDEVQPLGDEGKCEGVKDVSSTQPNETPSATHITMGPVQKGPLIEKGVHTPIPTPPSQSKGAFWSFGPHVIRETSVLPSSSQKDLGEEIRVPSPKGSADISTEALVASHSLLELTKGVSETPLRHTEASVLEQPKSPLNPSVPVGSEPLVQKIDRTLVVSPSVEIQGSVGSPRDEALKANTEGLKSLIEVTQKLRSKVHTAKASVVTKEELFAALVSFVPSADLFQRFQDELFSSSHNLVTDLIEAGYSNYSSLEDNIKRMVNSAIVMGQASSSSQASLNQLCTKRDFEAMVQSLAQTVTRQNEAITRDFRRSHRNTAKFIQQVSSNLIAEGFRLRTTMRNYAADIRFLSYLNINSVVLSAEDLITRLDATVQGILDSILTLNPTTCSAEARQQHDNQGGDDPDDHEGENHQ
ncbi:hypothetical protein OSB04_002303 [Centaurea solstitialis]|uniref:Uncharacterized protein n=1 Tax=Centaurea solstitialis TaxID=347529 RepID=A0AA38UAI7_9ASTR|nr:hypothetical protein OSB04_002303 [Centaurea solstitialis]